MADVSVRDHEYHLVEPSRWPFVGALAAFITAVSAVLSMHGYGWYETGTGVSFTTAPSLDAEPVFKVIWFLYMGIAGVLFTMYGWWSDVVREANQGDHSTVVGIGLRYGMILFIASEVMFFVAWFWAYFNASLFPTEAVGSVWPPEGIETFDPFHLPLLNTLILLTSGTTVTWAHHALIEGDRKGLKQGLWLTVILGAFFSCVQAYEYSHAAFAFSHEAGGNIYSSTFFMATGFHGFHVLVGTIFLTVCLIRSYRGDFTPKQHFGFEAAAWYWHFVDVVWLFLFIFIYVLGR
ncbi:MAG: cytochrome c oxidase subunit 3 [Sphingomonadales bacterium]|jgi:cytochrome c oxidase subunit 3